MKRLRISIKVLFHSPLFKIVLIFVFLILALLLIATFRFGWTIDKGCGRGFLQCKGIPLGKGKCIGTTEWAGNIDCLPPY